MSFRSSIRRFLPSLAGLLAAAALSSASALAASPVSGFIVGQVISLKPGSFVVKSSFGSVGDSTVTLGSGSTVIEQLTASRSDLKLGACVVADGQSASGGAVEASRITISQPVKGSCSNGFFGRGGAGRAGRPGGAPPGGAPPSGNAAGAGGRSFTGSGNFGFASGTITSISGSTLTVKGQSTTSTVTLASSTELLAMQAVSPAKIALDACVRVAGTSSDGGATITASSVSLSTPGPNGCSGGFTGRP
jgi:hypothetical protein